MVKIHVEVFSDTLCPWCYIGKKHLDRAIYLFRQQNPNAVFEVEWKPFYLYPNLERIQGQPKTRLLEPIPLEIQHRIVQAGTRVGIAFRLDAGTTGPSVASHALLRLALRYPVPSYSPSPSPTTTSTRAAFATPPTSSFHQGISPASSSVSAAPSFLYLPAYPSPQSRLLDALFAAHFERGQDISSPAILLALAEEAGVSRQDAERILSNDLAMRETDTEAAHSGTRVQGVPTFTIQGRWRVGGMQEPEVLLGVFEQAAREEPRRSSTTREQSIETVDGAEPGRSRRGMSVRDLLTDSAP